MMEIVIKIPNFEWLENEEDLKTAVKEYDQGTKFDKEIRNALINGKILPEHHGRLIDYECVVDVIDDWINAREYSYTNATYYLRKRVKDIQPIIEGENDIS